MPPAVFINSSVLSAGTFYGVAPIRTAARRTQLAPPAAREFGKRRPSFRSSSRSGASQNHLLYVPARVKEFMPG